MDGDEVEQLSLTPRLRFPEFLNSAGWATTTLGEQGDFLSSLTGKSAEQFGVGAAKYVTYMNVFANTFTDMNKLASVDVQEGESQNGVRIGDVLFTVSSETPEDVGMASVVTDDIKDCYLNSFCTLFRFSEGKRPNTRFVGYLMRQPLVRDFLATHAQGSTRFNLSKPTFRRLPIAIPSAAEQQKIADCLTSLDEVIADQGRKVEALKAHKRGLMQQLFPREGETVPRLRFPEFRDGPGWEQRTIESVCNLKAGDFVSASKIRDQKVAGSFPCYGGNGLRGYVESYTHEGQYVLVGRQGALCGNVNLFEGKFHATEHALVATPMADVETVWLFHALDFLKLNRFSIGQAQPGLSVGVLSAVPISAPPTKHEQFKVGECLSCVDQQIAIGVDQIRILKTHKQALMQQLFPRSPTNP